MRLGMDHSMFEYGGGGGGGVGQFCLVKIFFFAFRLCKNFFKHQKVVHEFFFPSIFSLHITENEHFMRYAYTTDGTENDTCTSSTAKQRFLELSPPPVCCHVDLGNPVMGSSFPSLG